MKFHHSNVIVWDEMSIKEYIEYVKHNDRLEGIVDLGPLGRSLISATEVIVFMVQGINVKWKFPMSFYFSSNATKSVSLKLLIEANIIALQNIGLRVRMGICDMAFTNQSVYKNLGVTCGKPYALIFGQKVYFVHDTPQLIKLVRNNLMKHNLQMTKEIGKYKKVEPAKWVHIMQFYSKDRRQTSRMAPKLTLGHVFLKDFSKMRVKTAGKVLSRSVYSGMVSMARLKILKNDVRSTAELIKNVNDIFDLLNISKFSGVKLGRFDFNLFSNMHKFDKFINFVRAITIQGVSQRPAFLKGLEITLVGVKMLCQDLIDEGHELLYTRQLQQDCLENFFAEIIMRGGFCRNPTANQFMSNFKHLIFSRMIRNQKHWSKANICKRDEKYKYWSCRSNF